MVGQFKKMKKRNVSNPKFLLDTFAQNIAMKLRQIIKKVKLVLIKNLDLIQIFLFGTLVHLRKLSHVFYHVIFKSQIKILSLISKNKY